MDPITSLKLVLFIKWIMCVYTNKQQVNWWSLSNPGILSRRDVIQNIINTTFLWFIISCRQEKWHCSLLTKSFLSIVLVKCDFEDGLCGMEQAHWRIGSGSTPTKNTGPDYDHTTFLPEGWFEWYWVLSISVFFSYSLLERRHQVLQTISWTASCTKFIFSKK